jgi:thioredoxin:protein disulfide reductase
MTTIGQYLTCTLILLFGLFAQASVEASNLPDMSGLSDNNDAFLSAQEAFKPATKQTSDGWLISFDIAQDYYLYKERIKFVPSSFSNTSLSFDQEAIIKQDNNFGRVEVFKNAINVKISSDEKALELSYQGCSNKGLCYPPQKLSLIRTLQTPSSKFNAAEKDIFSSDLTNKSFVWIILAFFTLGVGLSLTPCVFPMIPILSSIIAGQSAAQLSPMRGFSLSLAYVTGMASAYAMLGILAVSFGSSFNLASLTQSPGVIITAAIIFAVLSLAMFGVFELQMPSSIRNKLNDVSNKQKGGLIISTCLMGFFAALVVSPCVSAPLAGALLYLSTSGSLVTGASALFALGFGMGLPLLVIGLSGGKLLPKAGSWMLMIKSAFGIGLLIIAIELLARLLTAEVILGIYGFSLIILATATGAFDRQVAKLKQALGIAGFMLGTIWLVGGAMGNSNMLKPLVITSTYKASDSINSPVNQSTENSIQDTQQLRQAIEQAQNQHKKVLVDVYADWCSSCKEIDTLLQAAQAQGMLTEYQVIKFDMTEGTEAQNLYLAELQIFGPPALQRYSMQGKHGRALQGVPSLEHLASWLTQ